MDNACRATRSRIRRTVIAGAVLLVAATIGAVALQPLELSRTRSWHYSNFNVIACASWPRSEVTSG